MNARHDIPLEDLHGGCVVTAVLHERVDIGFAQRADETWGSYLDGRRAQDRGAIAASESIQHGHWRWARKVELTSRLLSYPTLGIEYDSEVQGLMMLCTDGKTTRFPDIGALPVVYIPFLASAPWNLPGISDRPRFRGVGTVLMRAAIEMSSDLGFKGRVALHSLPQADAWYQRLGMTNFGPDADKENLNYFEMSAERAAAFIR